MTKARDLADNAEGTKTKAVDAKGDLIVGTANDTAARLAVGTDTYLLTADNSEVTGLKWAAPAGGGKVLQVISAVSTTSTTISTSTYTDAGISATITPSSATSKILVLVSAKLWSNGNSMTAVKWQLLRDSTSILDRAGDGAHMWYTVSRYFNS
jgi:hypothetical protein